jgi:hypothetical protein
MIRTRRALWLSLAAVLIASLSLAPLAMAKHKDSGEIKIKGKLIEVAVADNSIQMPPTLKHGWVTFRITNAGTVPHSLSARGTKKVWVLAASLAPGQTALVPIKLGKGTYTVWEPLPEDASPHEAPALQTTLTVN